MEVKSRNKEVFYLKLCIEFLGSGDRMTLDQILKYDYRFKDAGDHVILNGAKMWISNSPFCDVWSGQG
jgi:hypothetical protein